MKLPVVVDEYMAGGNEPKDAVTSKDFAVLLLSDGGRYVGRKGQTFKDLRTEAKERGII